VKTSAQTLPGWRVGAEQGSSELGPRAGAAVTGVGAPCPASFNGDRASSSKEPKITSSFKSWLVRSLRSRPSQLLDLRFGLAASSLGSCSAQTAHTAREVFGQEFIAEKRAERAARSQAPEPGTPKPDLFTKVRFALCKLGFASETCAKLWRFFAASRPNWNWSRCYEPRSAF
jgi:hypothetical protein